MTARPEARNLPAEKEPPKVALLKHRLDRMQSSLVTVLGSADKASRTATLTMLYFARRPELQNCDVESIAQSVLQVAQDGLEVGRTAHLVAFGSTCTMVRDWRGDIVKAKRSGEITSCRVVIVREGDDFWVQQGLVPQIHHRPDWLGEGKAIGAYAVVGLPDGSQDFELMSRRQIEAVRSRSRAKDKGPWVSDWEEMAKKTVVKRLLKRYPGAEVQDEDDDAPVATARALPETTAEPIARRGIPKLAGSSYPDEDVPSGRALPPGEDETSEPPEPAA